MSIKARSSFLSLVIIAVLFFSAIGPTIVYADGGTTTDTPPTEITNECGSDGTTGECAPEVATVVETDPEAVATEVPTQSEGTDASVEPTATEVPASDGSEPNAEATALPVTEEAAPATEAPTVATEAAPATEAPIVATEAAPATEAPAAAPEAAPAVDTTILDNVPENTTVQVVNAAGQSEPLATQAAADAIATTSDPIWCPAGQSPTPGANGCTASFPSFNALLTFLSGNASISGPGTIFVQQGNYNGGESSIDFNNYSLTNISNAELTITGGWNTSNNNVDSTTTFTVPIVIGTITNPWGGALTINNITISNTNGTGLTVYAQDVTIDNSKFERNKTAGAVIRSKKNVTISNSSFSNPANARRQLTGLDIDAAGSVSLLDVIADQNRNVGATIKAVGPVTISISRGPNGEPLGVSSFSGTKNIQGTNFLGYGLQVVTSGAIAIDGITANDNFLWGASLNGGNVTIANSTFNANTTASPGFIDDTGLLVTSSGVVNLDNVQANDNRLIGATIHAVGDVSINDSSFTNNKGTTLDSLGLPTFHGIGLEAVSTAGSISVNRVDASNNNLYGAHLDAFGDVTISSNVFAGDTVHVPVSTFSNNGTGDATAILGRGLEVISQTGSIFLDHVTLDNNQTFGAQLQTVGAGDIFLDTVTATNNGTDGVEAQGNPQGNCTTLFLIGGTYSNNGQYGLSITNLQLNQSGTPVFATNGVGDIFQGPGTCVVPPVILTPPALPTPPTPPTGNPGSTPADPTAPTIPVTGSNPTTSIVSSVPRTGASANSAVIGLSIRGSNTLGKMTLKSFLANTHLAGNSHVSVFIGKYVYVYSMYGMQIFVYDPNFPRYVAMVGPH